nr:MAG TPA_asm: hypothetical protein [Caudoviricetes sp.]
MCIYIGNNIVLHFMVISIVGSSKHKDLII